MPNADHVQSNPDANTFLMSGGVPSASFLKIGASVSGIISEPPFTQQQRDMATNNPKTWDDGAPMLHIVITLQTDERDDKVDDDDGRRRIYAKNNMKKMIADAVRKSKSKGLEVGGKLTVTYTADDKPTQKGFNPPKRYEVEYLPPTAVALSDDRNEESDVMTWPQAVKYANEHGITTAKLKEELKKGGFSTPVEAATAAGTEFVIALCDTMNAPLSEEECPF